MSIPRNEYPRPQLVREDWLCLNGEWQFETDNAKSGKEKEYFNRDSLNEKITVPFCPESSLSGIGNTDFMYCVWYKRKITIPDLWKSKNIILHIGAADYTSFIYINGKYVKSHKGGYTPFSADITEFLNDGVNDITICCEDDYTSSNQPFGKQSQKLKSHGCFYTRTTGIWQTVWLEAVSKTYIKDIKFFPDADNSSVSAQLFLSRPCTDAKAIMHVYFENKQVGECTVNCNNDFAQLHCDLSETHLWDIGCGNLYDVECEIISDGEITDRITSYFGLRSIALKNGAMYLNSKPVFMRLVLDQGFYPDGIYTAPTDEAMKNDILLSQSLGFNGARLHEKVFEPEFLYWADKLGYIVWGEYANWGLDHSKAENIYNFLPEWTEAVNRDFNHPSIVGWCPFNETWDIEGHPQFNELIGLIYDITKELDKTRPCIDTSGNYHVRTDIFDVHDYSQNISKFNEIFSQLDEGTVKDQIWRACGEKRQKWNKEPLFISEYGGMKWETNNLSDGWGYGDDPKTEEEFKERYEALTSALLNNDKIMGFCYTQLYDVEQETNGILTYERKHKFEPEFFYSVNTKPAAIEKI